MISTSATVTTKPEDQALTRVTELTLAQLDGTKTENSPASLANAANMVTAIKQGQDPTTIEGQLRDFINANLREAGQKELGPDDNPFEIIANCK